MTTAKQLRQGQDTHYVWQDAPSSVMQSWHQPDAGIPHVIVGGSLQFIMDISIPDLASGGSAIIPLFPWYDLRRPNTTSSESRAGLLVKDCHLMLGALLTGSLHPTMAAGHLSTTLLVSTAAGGGTLGVKTALIKLPTATGSKPYVLNWGEPGDPPAIPTPQVMGGHTDGFLGVGPYVKTILVVIALGGVVTAGNLRVVVEAFET